LILGEKIVDEMDTCIVNPLSGREIDGNVMVGKSFIAVESNMWT